LALGWPEQRLKIEWKGLDIAFFQENYGEDKNPIMILESKKLGDPLRRALEQAEAYSEKVNCTKLVASNGLRYLLFIKEKGNWVLKAYLDLSKLAIRHPYMTEVGGAPQLLTQLLP